ncbi:MAG: hypothetical protein HXY24_03095 [Rubrivivax sp.]|nr:hypothetical protein [Rubrivivax sp.]
MDRALSVASVSLLATAVSAQGNPTRSIRIVPFMPGSATEIKARVVGVRPPAAWGRTAKA